MKSLFYTLLLAALLYLTSSFLEVVGASVKLSLCLGFGLGVLYVYIRYRGR